MKKKIGIILYGYPIGTSSTHINSARIFAQNGYEVFFFIDKDSYNEKTLTFSEKEIQIISISREQMLCNNIISNFCGNYKNKSLMTFISNFFLLCFFCTNLSTRVAANIFGKKYFLNKNNYIELIYNSNFVKFLLYKELLMAKEILKTNIGPFDFIIGTDAQGLIIAHYVAGKNDSKIVYYNLELLLESECTKTYEFLIKKIERELSRNCIFTIIQDVHRLNLLVQDNNIDREKILVLPVSVLGGPVYSKSNCFHKLFGIDREKKIVLHAGNLADWTLCLEIAQSAVNWSDKFVLVIHTWRLDTSNYINQIKKLVDNKKIFLSSNPVLWDELPHLLSGADIGLVFYKNLGSNYYETGMSSNKIAQNLQVGLPVITNDYPTFRRIIDKYQCGKCVNNLDLIGRELEEIIDEYDEYRKNAFTCFNELYNFSKNFEIVLARLKDK